MTQSQKIIKLHKKTGSKISFSFADKNYVKVGKVEFKGVRRMAFLNAMRDAGIILEVRRTSESSTDSRKGYYSIYGRSVNG